MTKNPAKFPEAMLDAGQCDKLSGYSLQLLNRRTGA
jgi:hypothetical protein